MSEAHPPGPVPQPARRSDHWPIAGHRPSTAVAVLLAVALAMTGEAAVQGHAMPGMGILGVGVGIALVFGGLNSPRLAVIMLLLCVFFRTSLKTPVLPIELYHFAFGGAVLAAAIAVVRGRLTAPRPGALEAAMVLFVLWNLGSAVAPHSYPADNLGTNASLDPYQFIVESAIIPFGLYYICRTVVDRDSIVRTFLWTVVGFTTYSAWVSILPFYVPSLVWPRYIVDAPPTAQWSGRAVGVFDQPVENGLVLVVGFVVALQLATLRRASVVQRVVLATVLAGTGYAIYLTHTRAVWLAFGVALVIGALLLPRARTVLVGTILAIAALIGANWSTFVSSDRAAGGVGSVGEVDDRLNMIATAWWAIKQHPIFGWGISRFILVNTYHHQQWSGDIPWANGFRDSSHDNELGLAAELGLIGLALWVAVLLLVLWRLYRAYRTLPADGLAGRGLAALGLIAVISWIVIGRTVDLRYLDFVNLLVLMIAGIALGAAHRRPPDIPARPHTAPSGDQPVATKGLVRA